MYCAHFRTFKFNALHLCYISNFFSPIHIQRYVLQRVEVFYYPVLLHLVLLFTRSLHFKPISR